MPHSHHSHSGQFCKHAAGTLEEVVKQAIEQGFEVFGLTEHVPRYHISDLYPEEKELSLAVLYQQFIAFLHEASRLQTQYAPQITLLVGLETEFISSQDLEELSHILTQYRSIIQYIIGSVHHVNGIPIDFDEPTYQNCLASFALVGLTPRDQLERYLSAYFDAQYELLQRFKPEIVGHFDLCRLYTPDLNFTDFPSVWEKIERNVKYAILYGALFEVNAAAFRKNWKSAYPGEDVAELILHLGGRFALSDDSHGPHAVGLNYHRSFHYLKKLGLTELWYLTKSEYSNSAGRLVQPTKLEGWSEHPFWLPVIAKKIGSMEHT